MLLIAPDLVIGATAEMLNDMWREPAEVQPHEFGWRVKASMQRARDDLGVQSGTEDEPAPSVTP